MTMRVPTAPVMIPALLALALALPGCNRDLGKQDDSARPTGGPVSKRERSEDEKIFGDLSLNRLLDRTTSRGDEGGGELPVNKYLWQASLDTLSFMPLASTDPFTGVIATDWSTTPEAPGERFKVTAYMTSPELEASSLKVAVYRQVQDTSGGWQPAAVDPETPLRIENAILTRARQIRIADVAAG